MSKTKNPLLVLVVSFVPGAGHVLLGLAQRGLMFIFFTVIFGWISTKLMPDTATFIGRHIGGIFIWGMSIIDAQRINRRSKPE